MRLRVLNADEIVDLKGLFAELDAYHNAVAANFSGVYPLMPVDEAIGDAAERVRENRARVEALYDDDGGAVGFCGAQFHGENGEIDWLYVREDLRDQGWGGKLLDNALDYLRGKGVRLVDLFVVKGNPAKAFYESRGFEERVEVLTARF